MELDIDRSAGPAEPNSVRSFAEPVARAAFASVVVLVGAARVLDEVVGAPFGTVVEALAGVLVLVAGATWSTEGRPLSDRAGDLAGLSLIAFTLLAHTLVGQESAQEFLRNGVLGITFATFVGATTYRASRTAEVASPMVGVAGVGLLFVGVVNGWLSSSIDGLPTALLVGGAGLGVLYVVLDRTQVGAAVQSRPFRFGAGSVLLVALSALLGVAGYTLAVRHDKTWDWTGDRSFSLSDHTIRIVEGLDFDVELVAFVRGSTPGRQELEGLVRRIGEHTSHLKVEWVDPLQEPLRAKNAEVTGDQGTVILRGKDRERRLEGEITEEELTRELVLLGSDEDHEVCWTMGHGEPDPDDEFGADGLGAARLQLEGMNYQVKKVTPATTGIPRSCRVVVVARPTTEWWPYEREALAAYVAEGGRLLVLVDAGEVPEFAASLERFGVIVGDDVVLDLNLKNQMLGVNDPSFVVLSAENFGQHPITRNLSAAVVMPIARSVKASTEDLPGIEARDLLHTSSDAWGETDLQSPDPTPDPNTEVVGEVPVVAVVEISDPTGLKIAPSTARPDPEPGAPEPAAAPAAAPSAPDLQGDVGRAVPADFTPKGGARIVVIGDSDFAANQYLDWGNNRDLFLNSIAWLAAEEDQIGERPPAGEKLTLSIVGESLWCLLSVVVIPGGTATLALLSFLYRRYQQ